MENLIHGLARKYSIAFIVSILTLLALGLLCYTDVIPELKLLSSALGNSVQSIIMMVILLFIPLTLSIFRKKSMKWSQLENPEERLTVYARGAMWRLMIFNALGLLCIFMHLFISKGNAMTLLIMIGVFYFFILPNKVQMCREVGLNPDGSIFEEEAVEEPEKVGNFIVMEEEDDDDDDFIPRNPRPQAKENE